MIKINATEFRDKIYDYTQGGTWQYKGLIPSIVFLHIDGPYMDSMLNMFNELEGLYSGKVHFYSLDVNTEPDMAEQFGIVAVPTTLLIPIGAQPAVITGLTNSKEKLEKVIMSLLPLVGAVPKSNLILPGQ